MANSIEVEITTTVDPSRIYAALTDGPSWTKWGVWTSFDRLEPGQDGTDGVGSLRRLRTGRNLVRERIVELVPDKRYSYTLVDGLPLLDYRSVIDLTEADGRTTIRWHSTFRPERPGTGWVYALAIKSAIKRSLPGLIDYASKL